MRKVSVLHCIQHGPRLIKQRENSKLWKAEVRYDFFLSVKQRLLVVVFIQELATQILLQKLISNKHLFEAQKYVIAIVLHFICV